jgi:hypothetical protein
MLMIGILCVFVSGLLMGVICTATIIEAYQKHAKNKFFSDLEGDV